MARHDPVWRAVAGAVVAAALALALYTGTRAGQHTFDAFMFTAAIKHNVYSPGVFRPHNLLYLPSALLVHRTAKTVWPDFDPFLSGQLLAAAAGAASVGLFYVLMARLLGLGRAALLTALFATTHALWAMSTEVEVYTLALLPQVALYLWLLARRPQGVVGGCYWGLAILGHLTNVLLALPLAAAWVARRALRRPAVAASVVLTAAGLAAGVYLIAGLAVEGVRSPRGMLQWIEAYALSQPAYGLAALSQIPLGVRGLADSLAAGAALYWLAPHLLLFGLASVMVFRRWRMSARRGAAMAAAHLAANAAFFTWWEPLNIEFWVATTLPLLVLVALGWRAASGALTRHALTVLLVAALAVQIVFNTPRIVARRDPAGDEWLERARRVAAVTKPYDLIVTFNDPLIAAYFIVNGRYDVTGMDVMAGGPNPSLGQAARLLKSKVERVRAYGGGIYVTPEGLRPTDLQLARIRASREEYLAALREATGSALTEPVAGGLLYR
ncbi:MAG: hypothetical protein N2111_02330 [Candidatus Sumerlaeaceae bacterium]|nr:hypothetical protein [Candidatus Sumerlaeaceae bacterium]